MVPLNISWNLVDPEGRRGTYSCIVRLDDDGACALGFGVLLLSPANLVDRSRPHSYVCWYTVVHLRHSDIPIQTPFDSLYGYRPGSRRLSHRISAFPVQNLDVQTIDVRKQRAREIFDTYTRRDERDGRS